MDKQLAMAILQEAKRGGFLDEDIPEQEDELIKEGKYWVDQAEKAYEAGMRQDTILAILNLAEILPPLSEVQNEEPEEATDSKRAFSAHQGLPIPKDFDDNLVEMPRDIHELTDRDVRRLSGHYNAYLSRAKWLLALYTSDLANATHLRDHAYRVAFRAAVGVDNITGKNKVKDILDAEAREDKEFSRLEEEVLQHQDNVTKLKALVDIYSGNVDRLSREWTMRQDEYEKTR